MAFLPVPNEVCQTVCAIDPEALKARGITLLLADLDNTLARYGQQEPEPEILAWRARLRPAGITLFLLSNSRRPSRVQHYAKALDLPALGGAGKPLTAGYRKAMAQMGRTAGQTAMVGDQIFTDIWGARRCGIYAILVEPIHLKGNLFRTLRYGIETPFRAAGRRKHP